MGSDPPDGAPEAPVEAGLRLIADRLDVPAAVLFAADPTGALHVQAAVGTWGDDADAVQILAESLGRRVDILDGSGVIEGARFAAGARLGDGEGALLVLAPDARQPTEAWNRAFATSAQAALGLVRSAPRQTDTGHVLHEVSTHPGTVEDRLALALQRATEALGMDAAAFALVHDGVWQPTAVFDPSERLVPTAPVSLSETFCAVTIRTDGPFAVEDAAATALGIELPLAYLGAPVFVGGRCVGTFSVVGHRATTRPFSEEARALVDALARWLGVAMQGRAIAQDLAGREADLSAFFNAAPMGMGVARLLADDIEFARVNVTAAAWLGADPAALIGQMASAIDVDARLGRHWLAACRTALESRMAIPFETTLPGPEGRRTLATTVAPIADADDGRFTFVVEDVTPSRRTAEQARDGEAQIEALVEHAPVGLFAADAHGRLAMSRGSILDRLGLDATQAAGRTLADVFAHDPIASAGIADALEGRAASWTVEADGEAFEVRVSGRKRAGEPAGLIGVALDVSERVDAARAAEAAAEAQKGLLKHLHHEIRSPLTSILGYADLLDEAMPPEELVEVRDVISRAGERLLAALDELMHLGAEPTAHPTPTDVVAVVAEIAEASRPAAEARRIALSLWCTIPEAPLMLDAGIFARIVRHLVSGAIASAESQRVDIRLETDGPGHLRLTVVGGVPTDKLGMGTHYLPRLATALGGTAQRLGDGLLGWTVRLPRQSVPMVELPAPADPGFDAEAVAGDVPTGEAPTMAVVELAA